MHKQKTNEGELRDSNPHFKQIELLQVLAWPGVALFSPLIRLSRTSKLESSDILPKINYIVASTHNNALDPFIILSNFPFGAIKRLAPIRFFTYNKLIDSWYGGILRFFGSFPATRHAKFCFGLEVALRYMGNGQAIQIFPEGRRNRWEKIPAKSGVAVLAQQSNTMIIPVNILWHKKRFLPEYSIAIGKPKDYTGYSAQEILDDIRSLRTD